MMGLYTLTLGIIADRCTGLKSSKRCDISLREETRFAKSGMVGPLTSRQEILLYIFPFLFSLFLNINSGRWNNKTACSLRIFSSSSWGALRDLARLRDGPMGEDSPLYLFLSLKDAPKPKAFKNSASSSLGS